ncbi:ADP-ribosyl cyclase/cyclic ADP-ribose hydrolase [Citrus sinensis]|uniref:ADP-ribosyl cyclase/cyclic ADP-ribose hydrolase n=1 Tax=Citrus sinensis TaxID=2711 RepID=A0ACB8M7I1_CITSI|nr:ADP-ribosyl cyclase/cyclic ADP-ribose hydrolase [Citrus sinensis]
MASTSFQNVSHEEYDAFLNFRGEDTRKRFIGHLYTALNNKGIYVFRDDKQLEKGGSISPNLLKAIEESRISIIVLSKNYASSTWCLDELLKIVECKNREDQIFPIFYEVEPTVVRKQTASFGEAFAKHEEFFRDNIEKVQKWRHALKVVANISGWELKDRNESEFIEEIVNVISSKIRSEPEILKELVGMESRLEKLRFLMGTGSNDVRMIGIWGMGGLGKTTLARVVYDLMSHEFDGSSFLADVRENFEKEGSEISLQKQLLSDLLKLSDYSIQNVYDGINIIESRLQRKKVLLIIDDVADVEQLQRLVGRRDWFGPGSKILITTRDRQLLVAHEVDEEHILDLDVLNNDEALQLFSMKAFKSHQPMGEYVELSKRVLEYAGGLPLALKVLGSFLIGRSADLWRSALERLKKDPSNKIMSILQISFEGLQDSEKKIFLDVACFFKWKTRDYVTKILDGCGFSPVIGIEVLIERSLLTVDGGNRLGMHDLLQELGQLIVMRQSPEEPGNRSRLWKKEEVRQVLIENTGGEVVEGIIVNAYFPEDEVYLSASAKAFSQMTNLRLLKISNVQLPEGLEYLSNRLRLLDWHRYPLKSLPSNLQLDKIVEFKMCYSRIEELWKGFKPLNMLRVLKLSHSENLIKTPDFTKVPNLEVLDLEGCKRLCEIHQSLLRHNKLILLNLKGCTSLTTLPGEIFMESLKTLVLSGCSKLKEFPDIVGGMECLQELRLDGTDIKELLVSIELMSGLVSLNLKDCRNLASLPITIGSLECLQTLVLSGCSKIVKFPETVISVVDLSELFLDGTSITEVPSSIELLTKLRLLNLNDCRSLVRLPSSINGLKSLKTLNLSGCFKLENVPETVGQIESLEQLDISGTAIRQPPSSIFLMKNLKELSFSGCKGSPSSTSWFLGFPMNLMRRSSDPVALSLPSSLSSLCSLTKLDISYCDLGEGAIPSSIGDLCSLKQLYLRGNNFFTLPASIYRLSSLLYILLEDCKMLQNLPRLPASIHGISLDGCVSLETLSDVLNLNEHRLPHLGLHCVDCSKLAGNYDLALSLLKEYIKNSENMSLSDKDMSDVSFLHCLSPVAKIMPKNYALIWLSNIYIYFGGLQRCKRWLSIVVPGSEIPEWFEYQNNEGSSIIISTPPKTYKNSKLVGYAMCCVFHVPKYSLPYYIRSVPYPVHELSINSKPTTDGLSSIFFRKQFGQAMSDHLSLYYQNREHISKVEFDSPSGLELKRCGVHPIYVHQGGKFNQTSDPVWNLNEFGHDCSGSTSFTRGRNDDLDRAKASGSCCEDDAGSTTSSERRFLKRSLEGYVGAAEASGSGCCWELKDRNESEFIEEIVNVISSKIRSEPEILKELVGMESRLEKLRFLMGTGSNDVRMIGIWGMGGLGKTTLARVVYDLMSHEFDGSSFLADVREKFEKEGSEISLQKQLLSDLLKLSDYSIQNVYDGINIIGSRLQRKKVLL